MVGSASPRKPRVEISLRSSASLILLVAWRQMERQASSIFIPIPLSVTLMKDLPPFWISTSILVAPASIEFSTNSLTQEAGRSTTSPAAILLIVPESSL